MDILQEAGIQAVVIENIQDMMERDPQLKERGFYVDAWHHDRSIDTLTIERGVPRFSDTPKEVRRGAPVIGEHNEYVLGELLGLPQRRIDELQESGVFF